MFVASIIHQFIFSPTCFFHFMKSFDFIKWNPIQRIIFYCLVSLNFAKLIENHVKIGLILFLKGKGDLKRLLWFINIKNITWITYKNDIL